MGDAAEKNLDQPYDGLPAWPNYKLGLTVDIRGRPVPETKTDRRDEWRVAKKIKPRQRGALKLTRSYGAELLCVRYRENTDGTALLTTAELVVERTVIQKRDDPIVSFKIQQG